MSRNGTAVSGTIKSGVAVYEKMPTGTRANHLLRKYGITTEQYEELLKKQEHSCAICLRPMSSFKKRLCVDHNHKTGEIRGLLCNFCNRYFIGRHREDKAQWFIRASEYLLQGTGWIVPPKRKRRKKRRKKCTKNGLSRIRISSTQTS